MYMIEKYYLPNHPELDIEFSIYPTDGNSYTNKINTILESSPTSDTAPDIFTLDSAFVKHYVESDKTGDLRNIGFTNEELSDTFPVVAQIGQTSTGIQKGLSWQSTPGVLFYRASLAERYLGITSPEEFQEKVKDWDSFLQTAEELKIASEGACKMVVGSGDIWNAYMYNRNVGWVANGELIIADELLDFEELCKTMEADDLTHKGSAWSEVWFAGMRGELETLCYFLPTWGLQYTLKPNCVTDWDSFDPDSEENIQNATENGTYGDWRLTIGPTSYSWGGTWICTNSAKIAIADSAKKAAIHDLLYFFSLDEEWLVQYAQDSGDFVSSTSAVETIISSGDTSDPFLGGQSPYDIFATAAALANGSLVGEYDGTIEQLWNEYVTNPYSRGEKDLETCLDEFKYAVSAIYPEFPYNPEPTLSRMIIMQNYYHESFSPIDTNRFFVMPINTDATILLESINSASNSTITPLYEVQGESIQLENENIHAVAPGPSTITVSLVSTDENIQESFLSANIIVIDPLKTVFIPSSVTWLETEAFKGIGAECIVLSSDIWVIESNCFANCPNLKTVIWVGDPSLVRVSSPFTSTSSILFLSGNGLMPSGFSPANTGITSFTGF